MDGVTGAREPIDPLGRLMLAFDGHELPDDVARRLASAPAAGVTLFRFLNSGSPAQLRELTASIQQAASAFGRDAPPLLIAADQEGGQLDALGGATPFPGNMALGAVGDEDLAERVGRATGLELLAMGANVSYAPVCDLADNPANPHIGIRSFGSEPAAVARLTGAIVRGLRGSGVAAGGKHFPGLGGSDLDTHDELAVVDADRARLDAAELVPFRAAIEAGADVIMSAHLALPALTGDATLPATLSRTVMQDLIRDDLGFRGVTITDALDMGALPQGDDQVIDVITALRAGVDLLLTTGDPVALARIEGGLRHAAARGLFEASDMRASADRITGLRRRLGTVAQPPIDVVRSAAHEALAREVAERSITLVRDEDGRLPLRLPADARVVVVQPLPRDLTPADTSSSVPALLAAGGPPPPRAGRRARGGRGDRRRDRRRAGRRRHRRPARAGQRQRVAPAGPRRALPGAPRDRRPHGHGRPPDAVRPHGLPVVVDTPLRLRHPRAHVRGCRGRPVRRASRSPAASRRRSRASTLSGTG